MIINICVDNENREYYLKEGSLGIDLESIAKDFGVIDRGDTLKIDYKLYVREKSFKTNDIDSINYSFFKLPTNDLYYKYEKIESSWELEHYNGINYHTLLIRRYYISPKRTGDIYFDKLEGTLYTSKSNDETDIFDAFFDRKKRTIIKNNISSSQFKIFVKELKK